VRGRPALLHVPLLLALALAVPRPAAAEAQEEPDEPPAGDGAAGEEAPWTPDLTTPVPPAPPPGPTPVPGDAASATDSAAEAGREPDEEPRLKPGEGTWLDQSHGFLESKLFAPVIRFDRFFSDETELEPERARSFLRWRNEVRFEQAGDPRYTTSVRANLRFPAITRALRRLRLVLEGETRDAFDALFPGEEPGAGDAPLGQADAELRLGLWDGLIAHADLGAGLLFELPPGAFGRLRLRWNIPVGDLFLTRLATIGFYRTDEGFGVSTDVHLERPFTRRVVTRLSSGGRLSESSPGVEWRSELAMFVGLGRRAAAAVGVGVNGATERVPELDRFRVFTRLRRDFYRRWLFFELEPEYYWPYTPERGRHATWAVTGRLEVQFQGREPERDPADEEPADPPPPPEPRGPRSPPSGPG
jgi:hypothetical protein